MVEKRFGERQPAFDGHHEGHATGAQAEEPHEHEDAAVPQVAFDRIPQHGDRLEREHAEHRDRVVGDHAPQHEPVFLVAAGPRPVQHVQREHVEHEAAEEHEHHDRRDGAEPVAAVGRSRRRRHGRHGRVQPRDGRVRRDRRVRRVRRHVRRG